MQTTYYNAFDVLNDWLKENGYTISNFELIRQRPDNVLIWVIDDNPLNATHFICEKNSPTQFLIWGYNASGSQVYYASVSYAKPHNV